MADNCFTIVVLKAHKIRVTNKRKMTKLQMAIHVAKTTESAKKFDRTPELTKSYHLRPARKHHYISL